LPQIFTDSEFQSVVIREICGRFLRRMENTTVDCNATIATGLVFFLSMIARERFDVRGEYLILFLARNSDL
jgi:hypothetical protein